MATNGNLNFTNVNKVTFEGVGAAPNAVIDTTTGKIGVGVDSPDANLHVVGNCHVSTNMELGGTLVMGTVTVEAQHALSAITATGNTTPHTIEFQNAETSLVTTGNVVVGKELTVSENLTVSGDVTTNGARVRTFVGRSYMTGLSPNIWSVAGESADRITNGAITLSGTFIQQSNGKSVWVFGAQGHYVDISSIITTNDNTVTQAIAIGISQAVIVTGVLVAQGNTGNGDINHYISYNGSKMISYDNYPPGGNGFATTDEIRFGKEDILVVRRDGSTVTFWINGVNIYTKTGYSEIFSGSTPNRTRLGDRNGSTNVTPVGMGISAYAAWTRPLTDTEIRSLTYDNMTAF